MGNHEVGRAMGRMAEIVLKLRTNPTTQTALSLLDQICEPYRGADAEFEAVDPNRPGYTHPEYGQYTDPKGPLGILIQEAFGQGIDWDALQHEAYQSGDDDKIEDFDSRWYDGPYKQFSDRYKFC